VRYDLCAIKINAFGKIGSLRSTEEGHLYVCRAVLSQTEDGIINTQKSHANVEKDRPGHLEKKVFVGNLHFRMHVSTDAGALEAQNRHCTCETYERFCH
jgi:hypothetical protein